MSRAPRIPQQLAGQVFSGRDAIEQGLLTVACLRTTAWRRLFQGVYADANLPITHDLRCRAALRYLMPPDAVIAGRSAARLHAPAAGDQDDPIEVLVQSDDRRRSPKGTVIHCGTVPASQVRTVLGVRTTDPVRTCWDLSQWHEPITAVPIVDRLLAASAVFEPELDKFAAAQHGMRGVGRFRALVDLADRRAESPPESRLRVRLVLAGMPRPETQYPVFLAGRFVARVDLAWPPWRLAVEYDGVWHVRPAQLHADRRRLNQLVAAGWTVLHVTSARMAADPDGVVAEVREVLTRLHQNRR